MKTSELNPFPVTTYISSNYFCNRELELNILFKNSQNGLHTSLFAQRRIGKTGLIKHFFNQKSTEKETKCLYIDIFSTQNQAEFAKELSNEIFQPKNLNRF
jgi:AAA+ ATPase superfamily predicted ATPase